MVSQTSFRNVLRPVKKTINTDVAGVLSFQGRVTSFNITSGQSLPLSSITNTEHLIEGQVVPITNESGVTILLAGNLMADGNLIDIEHNTTSILHWIGGKFQDGGGTAKIKNVEEALTALNNDYLNFKQATYPNHTHNATGTTKVKATDLLSTGGNELDLLRVVGGKAVWTDPFNGVKSDLCILKNSDTTTNINTSTMTEVPLNGTVVKNGTSKLSPFGNGIKVTGFTGWVKATANVHMYSTGSRISLAGQFAINGNLVDGRTSNGYIRGSTGNYNSSICLTRWLYVVSGDVVTFKCERDSDATQVTTMDGPHSLLELDIPANAMAKGDPGADGYSGWNFLSGNSVPHGGIGSNGDVYLLTTTSDLYKKVSNVWSVIANIKGSTGNVGPSQSMIWAEESSSTSSNNFQWSFGNGATGDMGLVMPKSGTVTALSINAESSGGSSTNVELYANGLATGKSITLASGQNSAYTLLANPFSYSAGMRLGFKTILSGGAYNLRVAAIVQIS